MAALHDPLQQAATAFYGRCADKAQRALLTSKWPRTTEQ